jgi:ribosome-binding protein aMBF1 (putative translation factor)
VNKHDGHGDLRLVRIEEIEMKTTKCPVCDWEIKDGGIKVKVAGKEITVCCDDCAKQAQAEPKKYAAAPGS